MDFGGQPVDYASIIGQGQKLAFSPLDAQQQSAQTGLLNAQTQQEQALVQAAQQKQQSFAQFQTAIHTYDGSATSASKLIAQFPEYADQLKASWDLQDNARKQSDLTELGQIYSAASGGNWDLAKKLAHQRADAEKANGYSDPTYDAALGIMDKAADGDPTQQKVVLNLLGTHLAAVTGPDHFGTVYGALNKGDGGYTLQEGGARFDGDNKMVAHSPLLKDADGNIRAWNDTGGGGPASGAGGSTSPAAASVASALASSGIPAPVVAGFMGNFHAEGGYDGAQGDGGSATGIGQWRGERAANFERVIGKPVTDATPVEQAKFVSWEMQNPEAAGMTVKQRDAILSAKTPAQAAALIDQYYERSSGRDRNVRMSAATAFAGGSQGGQFPVIVPGKGPTPESGYMIDPTDQTGQREIPRPGGSKDPDASSQGPLKPQALEAATVSYIKTGKMPAGMGGQALKSQILNYVPTIMGQHGLTPDDMPSIQQQFGADSAAFKQRVGQLSYMRQSVGKLNQHAQDLSALIKAVPAQTNFKPFNWITQGAEGQFSNSTVTQLQAGLPLFEAEVARVMTGNPNSGSGQLSDNARHEFAVLSSMAGPSAKIDAVNRIMKMTEEAVKSTRDETGTLKARIGGGIDVYAGNKPQAPSQDQAWITLPSGLKIRKIH